MTLDELFTTGSKLADVPDHFRGMPFRQWRQLKLAEQCSKYLLSLKGDPADAPLSQKRILTPRDQYGMKGFR